ncbi:unnamed protein product, partial [Effrenium voratum]
AGALARGRRHAAASRGDAGWPPGRGRGAATVERAAGSRAQPSASRSSSQRGEWCLRARPRSQRQPRAAGPGPR